MEVTQIPTGHLGNLSDDQRRALKDLWACFYALQGKRSDSQRKDGANVNITEALKSVKACGGYDVFYSAFWASPFAGHPDSTMLRYLRSRKWDISAAITALANGTKWRIETGVDRLVEKGDEVLNKEIPGFHLQMKSGKLYIHGTDRQNRPVYYAHAQLHDPKAQSAEALLTSTIYTVETGRLLLNPPTDKFSFVIDLSGFGLRNMDWGWAQLFIKTFQAYYPETLGNLYIHRAPWLFGGIWKIIKGLLDPVVASKFVFTRSDEELFEYIHPDQLLKSLGGNDDWSWSYTEPVEGGSARCHDEKIKAEYLSRRAMALRKFEDATKAWLLNDEESISIARDKTIMEYRIASIEADPYIRPRSVYHRHGIIREDGTVLWHYESAAGDQTFGTPVEKMRETLKSAPEAPCSVEMTQDYASAPVDHLVPRRPTAISVA